MYQTNPTEMFRERELALHRKVQERRHSRRPWGRRRRMIALWGRASTAFFRA